MKIKLLQEGNRENGANIEVGAVKFDKLKYPICNLTDNHEIIGALYNLERQPDGWIVGEAVFNEPFIRNVIQSDLGFSVLLTHVEKEGRVVKSGKLSGVYPSANLPSKKMISDDGNS